MNRGNFRGTGARSRSGSQQNRICNQNGHLSNWTNLGPAPLDQDYISYQSDQSFHFPTQNRQGFSPNHFNHPPSRGFFNQGQPRHAHNIPPFSSVPINKINPRIPSQTFHSQRQNVGKQNNDRMALQTEERDNSAIRRNPKENQQRKGNARPIIPLFPSSNQGQSISCIKVSPTATEKDTVLSSEGLVQFKTDVKDMLEQRPDKSVKFTSFIETLHQLLGRQCKLSSYGYTRLIQLLEALPDVVKIQGTGDERIVSLIMKESAGDQDENKIEICTGKIAPRGKKKKTTREKTKEVVHESESASLFQFKTKQEVPLENIVGTESEQESNNDSDNESVFSMVSQVQELYLDDGIEHSDNLAEDFASKQETQGENEIAIFWDIENCPVPKTLSTSDFVKRIREKFCSFGWKEIEFIAINDGQNEKLNNELHELRIETSLSVIGRKNSADDVMKDKMNCFVEKRSKPCTILLISGDVDFSRDLAKFRYTYKYKTILMHNRQTKETLKSVVAECVCIEDFAGTISSKDKKKKSDKKKSKVLNVEDNVGISKAKLPENTLCIEVEFKDSQVSSKSVNIFLNELNSLLCQKLSIESTFDKKSVTIQFSSDHKKLQAKTSLRIRSGKKKLKKCKDFFESLSDDDIKILCFYEKIESTGDIFFNDDIKKKSVKDLKSKIARLQKVHNSRIDSIKSKVEEQRQFEDNKKEDHTNATNIFKSSEQNQASNAVTVNLTEEIKDLEDQLTEFKETCEKIRNR